MALRLASCNYLGFDLDPEIIAAVPAYLDRWGTHPSWSRLLGSPVLYEQIEEKVTELVGGEDTLLFPTITHIFDDYVWTLDFATGVLTRIAVGTDRVVGQKSLPPDPTSLAVGFGAVCVSHRDGRVTRVDPESLEATELARVDGSARAIAVDGARESVWVDVTRSRR